MTDEQLKEIEGRLQAITPGDWQQFDDGDGDPIIVEPYIAVPSEFDDKGHYYIATIHTGRSDTDDATFIQHAPADIAALLAEVRRLQTANVGLIGDLADMVNQHCTGHDDELVSTGGLSANEDAIDRLEALGILREVEGRPNRYQWVAVTTETAKPDECQQ